MGAIFRLAACLEPGRRFLVNVTEPLPLLALLDQAGGGHDEDDVDADHAEDGREDVVDEDVGERGDRGGAGPHEGRCGRAGAHLVGDEGGRGAVKVAAALELFLRSVYTNSLSWDSA